MEAAPTAPPHSGLQGRAVPRRGPQARRRPLRPGTCVSEPCAEAPTAAAPRPREGRALHGSPRRVGDTEGKLSQGRSGSSGDRGRGAPRAPDPPRPRDPPAPARGTCHLPRSRDARRLASPSGPSRARSVRGGTGTAPGRGWGRGRRRRQ